MAPRVVFVGAPGAGKSTIAAALATSLGLAHLDSDTEVERRAGMTVADIFVTQGERAFRELERAVVTDLLGTSDTVVSLGGGAIVNPDTRADLAGHRVAWLQVSLSDAATRAGLNQARPLLLGNVRATLAALLDERTPWYQQVATRSFDTSALAVSDSVAEIVSWLETSKFDEGAA